MTVITRTIITSCSHSGGPYQWSATDEGEHVGYGNTEEAAIKDLERLLRECAEVIERDAESATHTVVPVIDPATTLGVSKETDMAWVEYLTDRRGLAWVLMCLSEICGRKAEHIAHAWQDAHLAKRWATVERAVGVIVPKAEGL